MVLSLIVSWTFKILAHEEDQYSYVYKILIRFFCLQPKAGSRSSGSPFLVFDVVVVAVVVVVVVIVVVIFVVVIVVVVVVVVLVVVGVVVVIAAVVVVVVLVAVVLIVVILLKYVFKPLQLKYLSRYIKTEKSKIWKILLVCRFLFFIATAYSIILIFQQSNGYRYKYHLERSYVL